MTRSFAICSCPECSQIASINYGNRNPKRLWAGDEQRQIEYMILLHDSFKEDEKPQWLTMDEIIDYQKRMLEPVA